MWLHSLVVFVGIDWLLQRCELCPSKEGALKRTDTGGTCSAGLTNIYRK